MVQFLNTKTTAPNKDIPFGIGSSKAFETPTGFPIITVQENETESSPTEPVYTSAKADVHTSDTNNDDIILSQQISANTLQMVPL